MKWTLVILVLLVPTLAQATITNICGFETGDYSETAFSNCATVSTTTVNSGNYAGDCTWNSGGITELAIPGVVQAAVRFYLNSTAAGAAGTEEIAIWRQTNTPMVSIRLITDGAGGQVLRLWNDTTSAQIGSDFTYSTGWHRIDFKMVLNASTGSAEFRVDGTVRATGSSLNTGTPGALNELILGSTVINAGGTGDLFIDDVQTNDTTSYPSDGKIIARQCNTTTPNYNAWTKTGGTTIDTVWDNTPFTTATNANDASNNVDKQSCVTDFTITGGTGSTGHGTQVVGSADTINAFKVGWIGKTSNTTTDGADSSIFRTPAGGGGVDTTTATTVYTTADVYHENINASTPTTAQVRNCEVGIFKGTGTNTHTVEDIWGIVDFLPAPATTHPSRHFDGLNLF